MMEERSEADPGGRQTLRGCTGAAPSSARNKQAMRRTGRKAHRVGRDRAHPPCAAPPDSGVPCSRTCVMVQRRPASMAADMTSRKPTRWNLVSPYTSSSRPAVITDTTAARLLHARAGELVSWRELVQLSCAVFLPAAPLLHIAHHRRRRTSHRSRSGARCSSSRAAAAAAAAAAARHRTAAARHGGRAHQLGFSMPQAMAKTRRKSGVVDLHMT